MNHNKRWATWREFIEGSSRSPDSDRLECRNAQQFKHAPISMALYYTKNRSGWRNYFERAIK